MAIDKEAMEIAKAMLEQTGKAMMEGDFDTFVTFISLPHVIQTFEGSHQLKSRADVSVIFEGLQQNFADRRVTDMVRRCIAARFVGPMTIEATHETRLLSGNQIISGPYPSFAILRCVENEWKIGHSQYAVNNDGDQSDALLGKGHHAVPKTDET